jgi:hypothetical protein
MTEARIDRPRIASHGEVSGSSGAASGLGGIDPFQCNPDRDRLSSVNFRG